MRKLLSKFFRGRVIVPLFLVALIGTFIYYLSASQVSLSDSFTLIDTKEYNEAVLSELKTNFTGESYTIVFSKEDINDYLNSYLSQSISEILGGGLVSNSAKAEAIVSTFNRRVHLNIDYLFISTSVFFDFDLSNFGDKVEYDITNMSLGNRKLPIPDVIVSAIIKRNNEPEINVPSVVLVDELSFDDSNFEVTISTDFISLSDTLKEVSKDLDPVVLQNDYVGSNEDTYEYVIRLFSKDKYTNEEIQEVALKLMWEPEYFEMMYLMKKERDEGSFEQLVREYGGINDQVNIDDMKRVRAQYITDMNSYIERTYIASILDEKNDLYKMIYDYLFSLNDGDFTDIGGRLYVRSSKEIINVALLSRKGILLIDDYEDWEIYCDSNRILLGKQSLLGYLIFDGFNEYKIYKTQKEALLEIDYKLSEIDYPSPELVDTQILSDINQVIMNYENTKTNYIRYTSIGEKSAYIVGTPIDSQNYMQYALTKEDNQWKVLVAEDMNKEIKESARLLSSGFSLVCIPEIETDGYNIDYVDNSSREAIYKKVMEFEQESELEGVTLDIISSINNIIYLRTSQKKEYIVLEDGHNKVFEMDSDEMNKYFADNSIELPYFLKVVY